MKLEKNTLKIRWTSSLIQLIHLKKIKTEEKQN